MNNSELRTWAEGNSAHTCQAVIELLDRLEAAEAESNRSDAQAEELSKVIEALNAKLTQAEAAAAAINEIVQHADRGMDIAQDRTTGGLVMADALDKIRKAIPDAGRSLLDRMAKYSAALEAIAELGGISRIDSLLQNISMKDIADRALSEEQT